MKSSVVVSLLAALLAGGVSAAPRHFRTVCDGRGVWKLVDPEGGDFWIAANNGPTKMGGDVAPAVGYSEYTRALKAKFGEGAAAKAAFAKSVRERLKAWGFNAIAGWVPPLPGTTGEGIAYMQVVQFGKSFAKEAPGDDSNLLDNVKYRGRFPNVFNPAFAAHCRALAAKEIAPRRGDRDLIGWFTDNEITWRGAVYQSEDGRRVEDARSGLGMYEAVRALPEGHSGRQALVKYLSSRGLDPKGAVADDVKRGFLRLVAKEYFSTVTAAVREADPDHLLLGCRFMGFLSTPDLVWNECAKWNDVVSVNCYPPADLATGTVFSGWKNRRPLPETVRGIYRITQKPLLVTEWSYPCRATGHPCTHGAGERCQTFEEAAAKSELFVKTLLAEPSVVGCVHFRWVDQPKQGRWKKQGGEDCSYGLVNEADDAYPLLTEAFRRVHSGMYGYRREKCR